MRSKKSKEEETHPSDSGVSNRETRGSKTTQVLEDQRNADAEYAWKTVWKTAFAPDQRLRRGGVLHSTAERPSANHVVANNHNMALEEYQTVKSRTKQRESNTRWTMSTPKRRNKRARKVVREPKPRVGERDLQARHCVPRVQDGSAAGAAHDEHQANRH